LPKKINKFGGVK